MGHENDAKAAAGFSAAAAIAAALALLRKPVAGQPPVIPDEIVQLLVAIAGTSDDTKGIVQEILDLLSTGAGGQGWPANADSITALRVAVNPATGIQLPSIFIPSGMSLVIKAWALNPAWLWVGASVGEASNINQAFPLLPNEIVTYQVENADQVYVAAMTPGGVATAGCFVCLTVEQRRGGG